MADSNALSLFIGANAAGMLGNTNGTATAAGSVIGDATALTNKITVVTSPAGTNGVKIPTVGVGELIVVKNTASGNNLLIYPTSSSDKFNGGSGGAAVTIATGTAALIWRLSATDNLATETTAI